MKQIAVQQAALEADEVASAETEAGAQAAPDTPAAKRLKTGTPADQVSVRQVVTAAALASKPAGNALEQAAELSAGQQLPPQAAQQTAPAAAGGHAQPAQQLAAHNSAPAANGLPDDAPSAAAGQTALRAGAAPAGRHWQQLAAEVEAAAMRPAPPSWGSLKRKQPENAAPAAVVPPQAVGTGGQQPATFEGTGQVGDTGGSGAGAACNGTKQVGSCLCGHL